jgi:formylglycine-generating enzyme required for sulfatase activity
MKQKIIPIVLILILVFLYFLLPKKNKVVESLVTINIQEKHFGHKIDAVILRHIDTLKENPQIIKSLTSLHSTLTLTPFWADKTEVKQGDFYKFTSWIRFHKDKRFFAKTQPKKWLFFSNSQKHHLSGRLEVSANGVSFFDAFAYCKATSGRLPTKNEFLALSQGSTSRLYPWGDVFNKSPWIYQEAHLNVSIKGGSFPDTTTKEGIADIGNLVSEWTMGNYPDDKPFIQGGNAYSKPYELYALSSVYHPTQVLYRSYFVGFRCVYDKKPNIKTPWKTALQTAKIAGGQYKFNQFQSSKLLPLLKQLKTLDIRTINTYDTKKKQSSFQVMQNEVSVAQYQKFLADPLVKFKIDANISEPKNHNDIPLNWQQQRTKPNHPIVGIDWWSAYHFSKWLGGRLPSEQEFLAMQLHFKPQSSITKENKLGEPLNLDQETHNLFGNISEWTRTVDTNQDNIKMIVKGGSFMIKKSQSDNISFFRSINPHHKDRDIGFRVVFD